MLSNFHKTLLNGGRGHQAPRKVAHSVWKEIGENITDKKGDKKVRDRDHPGEGVVKKEKFPNSRKPSHWWVWGSGWNLRRQQSSVQLLSHVQFFATPWTVACQASLSITNPGDYSNSCPLSQWCHTTISSSVVLFSSHVQSFPASGSFQMSQLFASGDQSIGVSVSASVLPMNIQDWFPLGLTDWTSLQSKGLSRVFSRDLYSLQPRMEKLYTVSKNKTRNWLWLRSWTPYCQIWT